ncbi:MAG: hypothetical protein SNF33_05155 [Candidatus Algichlamydia australiensis]|nr:hypothetical protein [Chlamydiales bacterium]
MGKQIRSDAYTGPAPEEPGKKEHDPAVTADFENLLRVDESDEAPDQGKKNKTEEEEEKKKKEAPETEVPTSEAFQRFMDDKKGDEGLLAVKSPQETKGIETSKKTVLPEPKQKTGKKTPNTESEQELVFVAKPEPTEMVAEPSPKEGVAQPAPQKPSSAKQAQPTPAPSPTSPAPETSQKQTTTAQQAQPTSSQEGAPSQKYSTSTQQTTSSKQSDTSTSDEGQPPTTETAPELPGDTPNTLETALDEAAPLSPITEEAGEVLEDLGILTTDAAKKGVFEKNDFPINALEGKVIPEEKKTDKSSFMAELGAFPEGTVPQALPESALPNATPTAYTGLSKQVRALFDYMVGTIIVKKDTDQTTTTVMVNLKGSIFDGSKIVLTRYATSPDSLNVQLQGDPRAVKSFSENLTTLRQAFAEKKMNVHLQAPILLDEYFKKRKKSSKTVSRKGKK